MCLRGLQGLPTAHQIITPQLLQRKSTNPRPTQSRSGICPQQEVLNDNLGLLGKFVPSASPAGSRGTNPAKPILLPTHPLLLLFCSSYCWNNMWIYFPTCTPLSCSWRHLPVTERQASFTAFITKSSVPPHTSTLTRATKKTTKPATLHCNKGEKMPSRDSLSPTALKCSSPQELLLLI